MVEDVVFSLFCCFIPGKKKRTVLSQETRLQIIPSTDVKFNECRLHRNEQVVGMVRRSESALMTKETGKRLITWKEVILHPGEEAGGHDGDERIFTYAEQPFCCCSSALSQRCNLLSCCLKQDIGGNLIRTLLEWSTCGLHFVSVCNIWKTPICLSSKL